MIKEVEALEFKTSAQIAYDILKQKILDGKLKPGEKLSKRDMARLTGFSVIPVIEALNRLEFDGLVESKPLWGSFVAIPSYDRIMDTHILREAIECQVARILCTKADHEKRRELVRCAKVLDGIKYTAQTKNELMDKHYELHLMMAKFTGHLTLARELERIGLFYQLCRAVKTRREVSPVPGNFHCQLIESIYDTGPDMAEKIMREHVNDSLKYGMTEEN